MIFEVYKNIQGWQFDGGACITYIRRIYIGKYIF